MAIVARPVGTRFGPTLIGRVLPDPIKNKVGFGFFFLKNPGQVRVSCKTQPEPGPDPTRLQVNKITKKPSYIYTYKP